MRYDWLQPVVFFLLWGSPPLYTWLIAGGSSKNTISRYSWPCVRRSYRLSIVLRMWIFMYNWNYSVMIGFWESFQRLQCYRRIVSKFKQPLFCGHHFDYCLFPDSNYPSDESYSTNLVDPASSHMLVSKIKPCKSKYKLIYTAKLRIAHYNSYNLHDDQLPNGYPW